MIRTKLKDRILPSYTQGEEIFNMVSHIVGGAFGVAALVLCIIFSAIHKNIWGVVGSAIYGSSLILLYTMSSVYHGLSSQTAKKVMQVLDHCSIYFLIAGTYTPILFCSIRVVSPAWSWTLFGIVWGLAALATVFTAIDLKKYSKFSMICYIGMGWCIVFASKILIDAMSLPGILYLLGGGIAYTIGAVLYGLGKKYKYMHSVFHIFVLLGSVLHFFCILFYVI
ncbi:MAG: hemolysin III family protein [Oscillospiraceae bacterium]|nr:hemolysin III family protein [Oscillospiraceae bacterium]